MAAGAVLGEEPRPLRERIAADEFEHAAGRNPLGPASEFDRPRGVGLGLLDGVEVGLRAADLLERLPLPFDRRCLRPVAADRRGELRRIAAGLVVERLRLGKRRSVHPQGGVVFVERQGREQPGSGEDREREGHVEPVAQPPVAQDRHQGHHGHDQPRHDDRAHELACRPPALEDLEELKQKQEVPLRPGGRVGKRGIGRRAELGPEMPRMDHLAGEHRPHRRHQDHAEHHRHHGKHRHGVLEHLVGPEQRVGLRERLLRVEAVLAEQGEVDHQEEHERGREEAGVEREEPGERVMAVFGPADHELLE